MKNHRKSRETCHTKALIARMTLLALLITALSPAVAPAADPSYSFKAVGYLGDPVGSGDTFVNDFEPTFISDTGIIAFTQIPRAQVKRAPI